MGHRVNSFRGSSRPLRDHQSTRVIVTALVERDDHLLLVQLARGRFAGFWLLPSATVATGTVVGAVTGMVQERTGYRVTDHRLLGVVEEAMLGVLSLRFVFSVRVDQDAKPIADADIARATWFSRDAAGEVLEERDVVPTLGVMALVRAWAERTPVQPLESLVSDALCPCGSGHGFAGCCGWDAR